MKSNVDFVQPGEGGSLIGCGTVAKRLLQSGMNINSLRTNDTLKYDEWKQIDEAVLKASLTRLGGVADIMSRNLVYRLSKGLGKMVLQYQDQSEMKQDAQVSMDGISRGRGDRVTYGTKLMPLPIIHFDFQFTAREIEASRNGGDPLDTTHAAAASRKCAEMAEEIFFNGYNSFSYGGGIIYGLTDFPNKNLVDLTTGWDDSAATAAGIVADVIRMKQAAINDRHYGPYGLYVPTAYEGVLDEDYDTTRGNTIRDRILALNNISFVHVSDTLTADNVVLVELNENTIRMVEGLPLTTVQWDAEGGMQLLFKVMQILLPQPRSDVADRCGIVLGTPA